MGKYDAAPTLAAGLIRLARMKAHLTQKALAARAGVTQQVVSAYETGRQEPTLPTLQKLIDAAGFELRITLEPNDEHDRSLDAYLESLPPETQAEIARRRRERAERARLERVRGR